ncbi:MAG: polysaccharide deacetylase family protein [Kofleriaceae bacterium]
MGVRERLASALYGAGALGAMMRLRSVAPIPSTLSILTYHHIAENPPGYPYDRGVADATPAQFRRQMELVAKYANPVTIADVVRALDGGSLPKNPVMVTFDDGYKSCRETALPILESVGLPAVFFVATSFITERRLYWWERIALILSSTKRSTASVTYPHPIEISASDPDALHDLAAVVKDTSGLELERFLDELAQAFGVAWHAELERGHANDVVMTWDDVRALAAAGMDVESHSRRHRVLQTLDPVALEDELTGSREELEAQLGRPVQAIAYPVGRRIAHLAPIRHAVEAAGYKIGFTNMSGASRIWPGRLGKWLPTDRFDVARLATDRTMSDAMFFTQIAVPRLAYIV